MADLATATRRAGNLRANRDPHHNEGQGRRLTSAFEALDAFPALAESRNRVLKLFEEGEPSTSDLIVAIEADIALSATLLRMANEVDALRRGKVESALQAIEVLSPSGVLAIVSRVRTYDFFERTAVWHNIPERVRIHALATQQAAARIATAIDYAHRDRLMQTALLHDIGKLVLVHAYPGYPRQVHGDARSPDERLRREQRELGVDHALVGGVIARRWGLPESISRVIESHHDPAAEGEAGVVRLADMFSHYISGAAVNPPEILTAAKLIGLSPQEVRELLYELPRAGAGGRPRQVDPCPMSTREIDVLRSLAKGMVYKQIAAELGLSTSTVRTHLHNVYGKLGAMDRAQAVLIATERGWI